SFVFDGNDQFAVACEAQCDLGGAELEIQPTEVRVGGELAARPWIQSYSGVDNLPDGVDTLTAFQCFAPQGISGCGWESPLEAMGRALENMQNPDRPEYGFLREDALLAVLIVTDEVDCSLNKAHAGALFDDGVFFAEGLDYATSAVCWNAGVACEGDSPYAGCVDVDLDESGAATSDPTAAVLRPVDGYVSQLQAIAADKAAGREVLVSVIAGVPLDYNLGGIEVSYADSEDPTFQALFGIGAGCSNPDTQQTAIPPVRLKSFAEAFAGDDINLYSVCDDDYTPAINDIVAGI
ncbi:MAG: VWA domain-containing protein, partial [Myxococcales bacterium]|nr:VWA domain-containing protein [Myxococcales bacterium]